LTPALATLEETTAYAAVVEFLVEVGHLMAGEDEKAASLVLLGYALPFLAPQLKSAQAAKAPLLLSIAYSFVPEEADKHIEVIRALQNAIDDAPAFSRLLPHLVALERGVDFSDDLYNLFIYYAVLGLDKLPRLKAASIGTLAALCELQPARQGVIVELLPKLNQIDECFWEVRANMAKLATALLTMTGPGETDKAEEPLALLGLALASRAPPAMIIALSSAVKVLDDHPQILPAFVDALLAAPADVRAKLLTPAETAGGRVAIATAGGATFEACTLTELWPKLAVAKALMESARAHELDTLYPSHAEVLCALLPTAMMPSDLGAPAASWGAWLRENKDYLYVALCDEELCVPVTSALRSLFLLLKEEVLGTFSTLLSSLRMLTDQAGSPNDPALRTAISFLSDLHASDATFRQAVTELVKNFDEPMKEHMAELIEQVGS